MFSILNALVIILVVFLAVFFAYQIRVSPARKGLLKNENLKNTAAITPQEINKMIADNLSSQNKMEITEELTMGGEHLKENKITFPPLQFMMEDQTAIIALAKNPHWIFTYWIVVEDTIKDFESQFGTNSWSKSRPFLKVYNHNTNTIHEIQLEEHTTNWYINVEPDNFYSIILGRKFPCGKFVELAVSNRIQTASFSISSLIDQNWLPVTECWKVFQEHKVNINSEEFLDN